MDKKIYVPDIECDSCSKLIRKNFSNEKGIEKISVDEESVTVSFNPRVIDLKKIVSKITELGFRASDQPFERKSFGERWKDYKENKNKYFVERKILTYTGSIFLILLFIELFFYMFFLKNIPNFIANYAWWIFYLDISVAVMIAGIWHVFAYRAKVTCMVGMMIGMTVGMQAGMMFGAVVGATNGFFIGAMTGMLIGVVVGIITGKCCGIMGVMEGMMAGLMGGTMGPMISVMMFSDNLLWFMPIYMIINVLIVWGLSYMLFEEVVEHKKDVLVKPKDFMTIAAYAIIITCMLLLLMIFGPKSALIAF